jgi:DNA-directed RNA polymerase specialized sigma24 family protein
MGGAHSTCCSLAADRLSNHALVALMDDAVERGAPPCERVLEEAALVFTAFYRGQALAARVSEAELAALVTAALAALHRHCATFDRNAPFRAWLLDIARLTMVEYQHRHCPTAGVTGAGGQSLRQSPADGAPLIQSRDLRPAGVF